MSKLKKLGNLIYNYGLKSYFKYALHEIKNIFNDDSTEIKINRKRLIDLIKNLNKNISDLEKLEEYHIKKKIELPEPFKIFKNLIINLRDDLKKISISEFTDQNELRNLLKNITDNLENLSK